MKFPPASARDGGTQRGTLPWWARWPCVFRIPHSLPPITATYHCQPILTHCHPERSIGSAKRIRRGVEGSLSLYREVDTARHSHDEDSHLPMRGENSLI